jgi:GH25 family lysozyme M1 (1,4-beta-N-acetylmuramidase)
VALGADPVSKAADVFVEVDGIAPKKPARTPWTTHFIDVSNNQGPNIDFRRIARDARTTGITCVEMKATEGTAFTDPYFRAWRNRCEEVGLRTFAYHFARPDLHPGIVGARYEADHFVDAVHPIRPGEWRPMLDFETAPFEAEWVKAWNERVRVQLGVAPCLYSYWAALVGMRLRVPLSDGLILAYPNGMPRVAPVPSPWRRWTAHQYSWHGRVAGVPGEVDLNWTPSVWSLLAFPVRGAALEPLYRARRA